MFLTSTHNLCLTIKKKMLNFRLKNAIHRAMKGSIKMHRCVIVMLQKKTTCKLVLIFLATTTATAKATGGACASFNECGASGICLKCPGDSAGICYACKSKSY